LRPGHVGVQVPDESLPPVLQRQQDVPDREFVSFAQRIRLEENHVAVEIRPGLLHRTVGTPDEEEEHAEDPDPEQQDGTQAHEPDDELSRALREYVKNELAPYKYPRWVEFVEQIPKGPNGKILRYKLRTSHRPRRAETLSD